MPCLGYSNPFSDLFRPVCCHLQRLVSRFQGTTMRAACPLLDIVLTPNVQLRRLMRNAEASLLKICENDLWTVNERCSFHLETFHHIQWNIPWGQRKTKYCQYISSRQQKKQLTGTTNSNNYQTWRHWKIPCHLPIRVLAKQDSRRCSTASTEHDWKDHPHWSDCGCTARRGIPGKAAIQTVSESFSSQTWYNLMNVWICLNITGYLTDWYFRSCFSTVQDEISSAGELPSAIANAKTALLAASERVFWPLNGGLVLFLDFPQGLLRP